MAGSFLETTTAAPTQVGFFGPASENEARYIIGVVLFSSVFCFGFLLAWCQVNAHRNKQFKVQPDGTALPPAAGGKDVACPAPVKPSHLDLCKVRSSGGSEQIVVGRAGQQEIVVKRPSTSPSVLAPVAVGSTRSAEIVPPPSEPHPWQTSLTSKGSPTQGEGRSRVQVAAEPVLGHASSTAAMGLAVEQPSLRTTSKVASEEIGPQDVWGQAYAEDSDGWVGSANWAAARASRKKRVEVGVFAKQPRKRPSRHKVGEKIPPPPAPELYNGARCRPPPTRPPPELHVEVPQMPPPTMDVSQSDAGVVDRTNAGIHQELQSTATEDVAKRKKLFKRLCAKWHPDKNLSSEGELATEVFQYLQAQKEWYLLE